jgi:hypothetical protein
VRPVDCDASTLKDQLYVYNNKFTVVRGAKYFQNGVLTFPKSYELKPDGTYRTLFGPCVAHNGRIYRDSDHNVSLALRRLTAVRCPEIPGFDQLLQDNQIAWFASHAKLFYDLQEIQSEALDQYLGAELEALLHHADPHDKKDLRIQAWADLNQQGLAPSRSWLRIPLVLYKMKKDEIAKFGKIPRMIGDLGVAASLQGFVVTKLLKLATARDPLKINGGTIEFCAGPAPAKLEEVFDNLINLKERFYFVYFSDDACLSIRINGNIYVFNVDIKSCDASHGPALFEALISSTPISGQDDVRKLVEQLRLPIEIRSKGPPQSNTSMAQDGKRKIKVVLKPKNPMLYSGSTLTTITNGIASTSYGVAISEINWDKPHYEVEEIIEIIKAAVNKTGYMVTLEYCQDYSAIQFLKNSPVYDLKGHLRPLLNIGVLLRMSGTCKGDVPGRGPLIPRYQQFQAALLAGAYPHAIFPLLTNMRTACNASPTKSATRAVDKLFKYKVSTDADYPSFNVSAAESLRRYNLSPLDEQELTVWSKLPVEYHQSAPFVTVVLGLDYGLTQLDGHYTVDEEDELPFNLPR